MTAATINKVSKTSKLGTLSWSLQAVETCPGAVGADGQLVPACSGCYATTGCYNFPDTKKVRADNKTAWQEADWVAVMTKALQKQKYFRFFDSGDMYSIGLAEKIYELAKGLPNTKFWIPTRMQKFSKFANIINRLQDLPNVMVRFSSDAVDGTYTKGVHGSTILPEASMADSNTFVCNAPSQGGKCLDCRACYSKDIPVIGYIAHGKKMAKVIRIASI
jgi:Gene product 88